MEAPDNIPYNSLEQCTYRFLQQSAKSMNLPSNVKKVYLIEMIYAKKYYSAENLETIVTRIKEERKQTTKPRRVNTRKKRRIQGPEVSSTINSPPICATPMSDSYSANRIKKHPNILNPLISKRNIQSDRVLRSYNSILRRNTKYSILNYNDNVVSDKVQNAVSQEVSRQCEWDIELQTYRSDTMKQQKSLQADHMLRQPKPIFVDFEPREKQLVSASYSREPAKRERRLSGIYPLEPNQSYYQTLPGVGCRSQDGRLAKIKALVQKADRNPEHMIKNKMTQTVQRRVIQKPIVVSMRSAPKLTTVQDVVDYKIDGNYSNSSTESARESSNDGVIAPRMATSKSFQKSFENMTFNQDRNRLGRDYAIEKARKQTEVKKYASEIYAVNNQMAVNKRQNWRIDAQMYTNTEAYVLKNPNGRNGNQMSATGYQTRRMDNRTHGTENVNWCQDDQHAVENRKRRNNNSTNASEKPAWSNYNKTYSKKNVARRIDYETYPAENQTMCMDNQAYASENQTRRAVNKTYATNKTNESTGYVPEKQSVEDNSNATENQTMLTNSQAYDTERETNETTKTYGSKRSAPANYIEDENRADTQSELKKYAAKKYKNENDTAYTISTNKTENGGYVIDISENKTATYSNTKEIVDIENQPEIVNIEDQPEDSDNTIQNAVAGVNGNRDEVDYPNMSALTDVEENRIDVISEASTGTDDSSTVYYHKKIRAEQVKTQRLSKEGQPKMSLPRISEVFSQFDERRFDNLAQSYVSNEVDLTKEQCTIEGPLETLYNYKVTELEQPYFHRKISATDTFCVFSTDTTTTTMAGEASANHDQGGTRDLICTVQRNDQHNTESQSIQQLEHYFVYLSEGGDTSSEVSAWSPEASELWPLCSSTGAASIEEALEIISQDGNYMERIGMDVRMQCILCEWAGPKCILAYHIRQEHGSYIICRPTSRWTSSIPMGTAHSALTEVSELGGRLYVLTLACAGAGCLRARIAMLPKEDIYEHLQMFGRLTVYNKTTGEPHTWEGVIRELPKSPDEEIKGLDLDLSTLDLLPNSVNLKLVNGEWVMNSSAKVVVGQLDLTDIEIEVHVQVSD